MKECFAWYLPNRLKLWRERGANDVDEVTRIVAMNHQEAIVECEEVDLSFLLSCLEMEVEAKTEVGVEVEAETETETETEAEAETETEGSSEDAQLIDNFLSLTDFRIMPPDEGDDNDMEVDLEDWELVGIEHKFDAKEEAASEELAEIYLKQGLYDEAKEIYSKLSLQYSEKSVYFAELTKRLSEKDPKTGAEKMVKRGKKGGKKKSK